MTHNVDSNNNKPNIGGIFLFATPGISNINVEGGDDPISADEPVINGTPTEPVNTDTPDIINIDDIDYNLDKEGNAVDKDGNVFKTKDELSSLTTTNSISIDDKEYNLDKDGNAINEQNEIIYTKSQLDILSADEPYIEQVIKAVGAPILNDDGTPIQYEDSPIGVSRYIDDLSEVKASSIAEEILKERYDTYPILKAFEEHLILNGGRADGFNEDIDYSDIQLDENNEAQLINIIVKEKIAKGETEEQALFMANLFKKEGILFEQSQKSLKYLDDVSLEERQSRQEAIEARQLQEQQEETTLWNNVHSKIFTDKSITIGDEKIIIPQYMKRVVDGKVQNVSDKEFFDYMYTKYKYNVDGESKIMTKNQYELMQEDKAKSTVDFEVYEALRRFLRYDDSQIIFERRKSKEADDMKRLKTTGGGHKPVVIKVKTKASTSNIRMD